MNDTPTLQDKIIQAALVLFLNQGIKKTSLDDVAHATGITRMTVYRYFANKHALAEAALMSIPVMLEELQDEMAHTLNLNLQSGLKQLTNRFSQVPKGNLPLLLDETRRVYPDLWQQFHQRRVSAIENIFQLLLSSAETKGLLRPELNRTIVQAFFYTSVTRVMEDQALSALNLSANEIFSTVQAIFLYGILKDVKE